MSHLIHAHAAELGRFLSAIRDDRNVSIAFVEHIQRILFCLGLKGSENRPFSPSEILVVLRRYGYYRNYFREQGKWLDEFDTQDENV